MCVDGKLNFNEHVCRICSKAIAQISALQRLTGLVDYTSRKVIYTSCIASNFNYCPLVRFFTSRESIDKIDKILERELRFVLKDHIYDDANLLLKSKFESFRIFADKCLKIELFKILEGITPHYLSDLFVKTDKPLWHTRYVQIDTTPEKDDYIRPTLFSMVHLSGTCSHEYKSSSVAEWIYILNQIVARADMFMSYMYCLTVINVTPMYCTLRMGGCRCDGYVVSCGTMSLWQPVVPWSRLKWQHLPCFMYTLKRIYICSLSIYMPSFWR